VGTLYISEDGIEGSSSTEGNTSIDSVAVSAPYSVYYLILKSESQENGLLIFQCLITSIMNPMNMDIMDNYDSCDQAAFALCSPQ